MQPAVRPFLSSFFIASGLIAGCAPDIPLVPPPTVVVARFDPQASPPDVPLPNDLARDPVSHLLQIPADPTASPAQVEFNKYLGTLDGFPPGASVTANFTAPIKPESVTVSTVAKSGSIAMFDLTATTALGPSDFAPSLSTDGTQLSVVAKTPLHLGHTYAVAVFGGNDVNGVQGADGSLVVGSPFTFFLRSTTPLLSHCGDPTKAECKCAIDPATMQYDPTCTPALGLSSTQAALLEGFRVKADALLNTHPGVLDATSGMRKRSDIVLLWTFTMATGPFAIFDPTAGIAPFPNDVLLDQTTMKVNLQKGQAPEAIRLGLNTLDGFSTTADITLDVHTIDDTSPKGFTPDQSVILFDVTSFVKQPTYTVAGQLTNGKDYDGLVAISPTKALQPDRDLYVVVFTNGVTDSMGNPLRPSPVMQLIKSHSPLYCTGMEMT